MTDDSGSSEDRIVVDLREEASLELETLDVGVAENTISFSVTGTIKDVPDEMLDSLKGSELQPARIDFVGDDSS